MKYFAYLLVLSCKLNAQPREVLNALNDFVGRARALNLGHGYKIHGAISFGNESVARELRLYATHPFLPRSISERYSISNCPRTDTQFTFSRRLSYYEVYLNGTWTEETDIPLQIAQLGDLFVTFEDKPEIIQFQIPLELCGTPQFDSAFLRGLAVSFREEPETNPEG